MIKITTKSGFACEVNENIANDWRMAHAIAKSQSSEGAEQMQGAVEMVHLVLGEKQEKKLCKHVQANDGTVPTTRIMEEVTEILQILKEKNEAIKN